MTTTHYRPWMCGECGYLMDAASPASDDGRQVPRAGDLAICLRCGFLHTVDAAGAWRSMAPSEFDALAAAEKAMVELMQRRQRAAFPVRWPLKHHQA